jgi:hypothetical protein
LGSDTTDLPARVAALEADVADLRSTLARRKRSKRSPYEGQELAEHIALLHDGLAANGPLPERLAAALYHPQVVREALARQAVYRYHGTEPMLSTEPPADALVEALASHLAEGPLPMFELRNRLGKNRAADVVDAAVIAGKVRRGTVKTGHAGRPQVIVARADVPAPMFWDQWKVDWR